MAVGAAVGPAMQHSPPLGRHFLCSLVGAQKNEVAADQRLKRYVVSKKDRRGDSLFAT